MHLPCIAQGRLSSRRRNAIPAYSALSLPRCATPKYFNLSAFESSAAASSEKAVKSKISCYYGSRILICKDINRHPPPVEGLRRGLQSNKAKNPPYGPQLTPRIQCAQHKYLSPEGFLIRPYLSSTAVAYTSQRPAGIARKRQTASCLRPRGILYPTSIDTTHYMIIPADLQ